MHDAKRRTPRYPYRQSVGMRTPGNSQALALPAGDIGEGGLFLLCEQAPELLTNVELNVRSTRGQFVTLRARVVQIVTPRMAQRRGCKPGIGLQFEHLDSVQQAFVASVVEDARRNDPRRRVPRSCVGDGRQPPEDPVLAFLLAAIDGHRTPEQLAETCLLDIESVSQMLVTLYHDGYVAFSGATTTRPEGPPELGGVHQRAAAPSQHREEGPLELTAEQCTAIDARIALTERADADHYAALDLKPTATRHEIRQAFFALAKLFHPDAYYGKRLGPYRVALERLFDRLSKAYSVLGTPSSRKAYDIYLARAQRTAVIAQQASAIRPAAAPMLPGPSHSREATRRSAVERLQRMLPARDALAPNPPLAATAIHTPAVAPPAGVAQPSASQAQHAACGPASARTRRRTLATQLLDDAEQGLHSGDRISAVRQLDLVRRLDHGEAGWKPRHQERYDCLIRELASTISQMAVYEEHHQQWAKAACSWKRLREVRPTDPECARQAAHALVQAGGDLHEAAQLAELAVTHGPSDYRNHEVLGKALLAAKLSTRAQRTLLHAAKLRAQAEAAARPPLMSSSAQERRAIVPCQTPSARMHQ
ncbi:MAG TPA: DnaJ domain-containing protein [Polyangiales bacterium]